ncbi:hypothetical protein [Streptomyces sp. DSM 15324]|uniref:hypothetical protein n=1 Tax=Streptomyces sp. DSM 15324 TaxID=1739111 RepID=UPI000747F986|nr:hypothetical protein [Streptomyces sp. DSM 15324]KUO09352.1 hypothetical protein AQJ58_25490 [Streptomyces sp. DSM 15324]
MSTDPGDPPADELNTGEGYLPSDEDNSTTSNTSTTNGVHEWNHETPPYAEVTYAVTGPAAPPVTLSHAEAGETQVNTAAMRLFAKNIRTLQTAASTAHDTLDPVTLAPGGFYVAHQMRLDVTGADGAGLKPAFLKVLVDLQYGLSALATGIDTLAQLYDNTEADNTIDAARIREALTSVPGYFDRSVQDTGSVAT